MACGFQCINMECNSSQAAYVDPEDIGLGSYGDQEEKNAKHCTRLLRQAEKYCSGVTLYPAAQQSLYRNKPVEYFVDIFSNDGIMEPYAKDMGGDPRCPINNKVSGLFFGVSAYIPPQSPYGDMRMKIPIGELFGQHTNLYFADFFCMALYDRPNNNHYVNIVLAKDGSKVDEFCSRNLVRLDPVTNVFLRRCTRAGEDVFFVPWKKGLDDSGRPHALWIEVVYTEDINLNEMRQKYGNGIISPCKTFGQGQSKKSGIGKDPECTICNYEDEENLRD